MSRQLYAQELFYLLILSIHVRYDRLSIKACERLFYCKSANAIFEKACSNDFFKARLLIAIEDRRYCYKAISKAFKLSTRCLSTRFRYSS